MAAEELNGGAHGANGTNGTKKHGRAVSRKMSSPMMPAFMVSAPAKVILFGEHAVVHGKVSTGCARHAIRDTRTASHLS